MAARIQQYRSDDILVTFDPSLCIHVANCARGLPGVFKPAERPWVTPEDATADEIAAVIHTCPSGALQYQRLDGGPEEVPDEETTIHARPNGPLLVRGDVTLRTKDGSERRMTRASLCRCGGSANKPFCDLTHRAIEFRD